MQRIPSHANWVIWASLALALMLGIMPMPEWARLLRPDWALLVLLFWVLEVPQRVGVTVAFIVGICLDILHETPLGQHAIGLVLVAYLAHIGHRQVQQFPLWQRTLVVMTLLMVFELTQIWIEGANGRDLHWESRAYPILTGLILWPWLHLMLRDCRIRFRVT